MEEIIDIGINGFEHLVYMQDYIVVYIKYI